MSEVLKEIVNNVIIVGIDGILPHDRDLASGGKVPDIGEVNIEEVIIDIRIVRITGRR